MTPLYGDLIRWRYIESQDEHHRDLSAVLRGKEALEHGLPLQVSKDVQAIHALAWAVLDAVDHWLARYCVGRIDDTAFQELLAIYYLL